MTLSLHSLTDEHINYISSKIDKLNVKQWHVLVNGIIPDKSIVALFEMWVENPTFLMTLLTYMRSKYSQMSIIEFIEMIDGVDVSNLPTFIQNYIRKRGHLTLKDFSTRDIEYLSYSLNVLNVDDDNMLMCLPLSIRSIISKLCGKYMKPTLRLFHYAQVTNPDFRLEEVKCILISLKRFDIIGSIITLTKAITYGSINGKQIVIDEVELYQTTGIMNISYTPKYDDLV